MPSAPKAPETPQKPAERATLGARLLDFFDFGLATKWIVLSGLIGVSGGIVAAIFKWMIETAVEYCFIKPTGNETNTAILDGNWWMYLLIPTLGGLLTGWLIYTFAPEAEGHGTDSVIRSFHRLKGRIRQRVIYIKALTSAITIGTGGSAGQEGPVAQVGAGVGSSIATRLGLSNRDRRIFLLAGSSAGIGAMFSSPLGGALFMPEVLYKKPEFEGESIIPCIIASIFAYTTFSAISGAHRAVELPVELLDSLHFNHPVELVIYLLLGILCALVGWIYTRVFYGVHALFGKMKGVPRHLRPAIGGLLLGCVALALARVTTQQGVFFGGYGLITNAITGQLAIPILLLLIVAKIAATSVTISSGGSGGVFAPALAIGALLGAAVGQAAATLLPGLDIVPATFALVGMGGFFAGVAKVPVASVIMVSEMTGSYELLAPLMLVAVVHILLSNRWTLYQAQVSSHIDSPAHAGDFVVNVLDGIKVGDVMKDARPPRLVHEDITLRSAMRIVSNSHETHFPVVDDQELLVGIFSLTDLRRIFLEDEVGNMVIVRDFMHERVVTLKPEDTLNEALRRMTKHNYNAMPVVDDDNPRKVVALMERNVLGRVYQERLAELKENAD